MSKAAEPVPQAPGQAQQLLLSQLSNQLLSHTRLSFPPSSKPRAHAQLCSRHLPGDLPSQDTSHSLRATSLLWQPPPGSTGEKRCWKWLALPREKSYNALCLKISRQDQANRSGQRELATGSCQTAVRRREEGVFPTRGTDAAFL